MKKRRARNSATLAGAIAFALLLAGCGGGGGNPPTVTLTGTVQIPTSSEKAGPFVGARVEAVSLKDGRVVPGPRGVAVADDGSFEIPGAPQGHHYLIRAWKGARSVERITHRAEDADGDGRFDGGPVDTASTGAAILIGKKVTHRVGDRPHIERGEFSRYDGGAIDAALDEVEADHDDHEVRRLGDDFRHGRNLCDAGILDRLEDIRINAYLAAHAVIRSSRENVGDNRDDLRDWLRKGVIGADIRVAGKVMHVDCTLHDDPELDPDDVPDGDTTPPDTTITAGPAGPTRATDASFDFTASEAGSTFECALDGAPFAACASGQSYSGLTEGTHTFSVRATDPAGNTDATPATVGWPVDRTPPVLALPADVTLEAPGDTTPTGAGQASATDAVDASPSITFADGTTPGIGQLLFTLTRAWTATDAAGNQASGNQTIRVMDTAAPLLTIPPDATVEAPGDTSPAATGTATATDAVDPAPVVTHGDVTTPGTGPLRETITRTWTATDASGNNAGADQVIRVTDTTPPAVTPPAPVSVDSPGGVPVSASDPTIAAFLGGASATDAVDGAIGTVANDAPAQFGVGSTPVTFSATDASGNTGTAASTVTVVAVDGTPPVITLLGGNPVTVVQGAVYNDAGATALDDTDGDITAAIVTVNPVDTSLPGTYTVTYDVSDAAGNPAVEVTRTVYVADQTPPVVTPPADIAVAPPDAGGAPATDPGIAAFLAGATAVDAVDGPIAAIANDAPSVFPLGTTVVAFSATDAAGNVGTASARVTVARCGAATVFWTATVSGSWTDPGNWSTGAVPGPTDQVCIDVAQDVTVTHAQNVDPIDTLMAFNRVTLSGGTLDVAGPSLVSNDFTLSGSGTLTGAGGLTVTGLLTWTGGTLDGTGAVTAAGGAALNGGNKYLGRTFTVPPGRTADWTAGTIYLNPGGTIDNRGTFQAAHMGNLSVSSGGTGTQAIRNAGTFVKMAPASGTVGTTTIVAPVRFDNSGVVETRDGRLSIAGGGTHSGRFDAGGGVLSFVSDNTFQSGAAVTGAGTVDFGGAASFVFQAGSAYTVTGTTTVGGGTLELDTGGAVTLGTLAPSGGTLTGADDVTVAGPLTWTGGTLDGTGTLTVAGGAGLSGGNKYLGRTFTVPVGQTATWTAGTIYLNPGGVIDNRGTFQDAHPGNISVSSAGTGTQAIRNAGTFVKMAPASGTVGTTFIVAPVTFENSGAVDLNAGTLQVINSAFTQTAGTTTLGGGTLTSNIPIDLQGGRLVGNGNLAGGLANAATVAPGFSPGTIAVSGAYTQSASGSLDIELGGLTAGTGYDQLTVGGQATLGGHLNVSLYGGFIPAVNDTFDIVTYGSLAGGTQFTAVHLAPGIEGTVAYGSGRATLTITAVSTASLAAAMDQDPDLDGLSNAEESALGTDPLVPDTDGDGVGDGVEALAGSDPLTSQAPGTVLYVDAGTGNDAQAGTSWANAKATTAAALAVAPDGAPGAPTFILHDAGSYPGGLSINGRNGVALVGSVGPVAWFPIGTPTSLLDAAGSPASVVTIDTSTDVTLIGLTLTGGQATEGGGLQVLGSGPVRVFRTLMRGNAASQRGGGAYIANGTLELSDSQVAHNTAGSDGGGLYVGGGSLRVENSLVAANRAGADGGGIGVVAPVGMVDLFNNLLVGNVAATGGALAMTDPGGGTTVHSNTLAWNQATTVLGGGAIAYANPGLAPAPAVDGNVLWNNEEASVEAAMNAGDDLSGPITDTISTHNDIGQGPVNLANDLSVDPGFTRGFFLDQARVAPGGPVDAGGTAAAALFADGETTDAAGTPDAGQVDLGFHHDRGAPSGTLTVTAGYPTPLVGYTAGQAAVITPRVDGVDLGPGHRVVVRTDAGTTSGVTLSALSALDPLFTGDSALAADNGDGTYEVLVDTTAVAAGSVSLEVHVDDLAPQAGVGATGF